MHDIAHTLHEISIPVSGAEVTCKQPTYFGDFYPLVVVRCRHWQVAFFTTHLTPWAATSSQVTPVRWSLARILLSCNPAQGFRQVVAFNLSLAISLAKAISGDFPEWLGLICWFCLCFFNISTVHLEQNSLPGFFTGNVAVSEWMSTPSFHLEDDFRLSSVKYQS